MKKRYLQLVILFLLHTALCAQTGEDANPQNFQRYSFLQKNMVAPTSPEAASLGKYGDFNVNKYTGTANIGIPLYTLAGKTIQVPISLNYNASGLKVDESATWVGMGWALGAGGVITRSMQGLPDQEDNYFEKSRAT
ncbi:MAG: hypothetical protein HC892_11455 [Saprospiraceae bacterium]|nr:hypothetical protein [Saprospiraceae bacterium]